MYADSGQIRPDAGAAPRQSGWNRFWGGVGRALSGVGRWIGDVAGFDGGRFGFGNLGLNGSNSAAFSAAADEIVVTAQRNGAAAARQFSQTMSALRLSFATAPRAPVAEAPPTVSFLAPTAVTTQVVRSLPPGLGGGNVPLNGLKVVGVTGAAIVVYGSAATELGVVMGQRQMGLGDAYLRNTLGVAGANDLANQFVVQPGKAGSWNFRTLSLGRAGLDPLRP